MRASNFEGYWIGFSKKIRFAWGGRLASGWYAEKPPWALAERAAGLPPALARLISWYFPFNGPCDKERSGAWTG